MSIEVLEFYVSRSNQLEKAIKWHKAYFELWNEYLSTYNEGRIESLQRIGIPDKLLTKLDKARKRVHSLV